MSYDYQFKFYHPKPIVTHERIRRVLVGFGRMGITPVDYELGEWVHKLAPDGNMDAADIIGPDGYCLVGLRAPASIGDVDVTFQTYSQETKGAQATLGVGEEVMVEDPVGTASLLLEMAKVVNLHLPSFFGWSDHELMLARLESSLRFDRLSALAWANLFGKESIQRFGVDYLRALPVHQISTFNKGLVCLLAPTPLLLPSPNVSARIRLQLPDCIIPSTVGNLS